MENNLKIYVLGYALTPFWFYFRKTFLNLILIVENINN
jgi:hypothetical protein